MHRSDKLNPSQAESGLHAREEHHGDPWGATRQLGAQKQKVGSAREGPGDPRSAAKNNRGRRPNGYGIDSTRQEEHSAALGRQAPWPGGAPRRGGCVTRSSTWAWSTEVSGHARKHWPPRCATVRDVGRPRCRTRAAWYIAAVKDGLRAAGRAPLSALVSAMRCQTLSFPVFAQAPCTSCPRVVSASLASLLWAPFSFRHHLSNETDGGRPSTRAAGSLERRQCRL